MKFIVTEKLSKILEMLRLFTRYIVLYIIPNRVCNDTTGNFYMSMDKPRRLL